jgi:adenylate cyclase
MKNTKLPKRLKKILAGFTASTIVVIAILIFGSTQNDMTGTSRESAESLENIFYDLFFKGRSFVDDHDIGLSDKITIADGYDPSILIVDIDEPSLEKLGPFNEWDRDIHANVVKNLSAGGASGIGFDIIFKTADFGKKKAEQVLQVLGNIAPETPWDSTYPNILASFNYDSMLVSAIHESNNTIVCDMFGEAKAYKHESQWRKLSGEARAREIGFGSTINSNQVDHIENIEPKDLLDNIFPELAQAGAGVGTVNAYPDNDGVVRRITMFYRFPNMDLPATTDSSLAEVSRIDSSHIYSTMSLMTVLHLFHRDPKDITIKMGEYIDIGKPFGIYRDSSGFYHTTYPNFSYPMFVALREKLKEKKIEKTASKNFVDVTNKIIAIKDTLGKVSFDITGQDDILEGKIVKTMMRITEATLDSVEEGSPLKIGKNITLELDEDEDDGNHFVINGTGSDEDEEEGIPISRNIIRTLQFFADSIKKIPAGKSVHLSMDMDIHYDKEHKRWHSSQVILSDAVIRDIQNTSDDRINNLKPGEELRFGPVKRIPIDSYGRYQVNFKGRYNVVESKRTFQHLSYKDVSTGNVDAGVYQGKIFILGSAAAALFDFVPVPSEENYPAVLIHATIIKNILEDDYIVTLAEKYQRVIVIILALVCLLLGLYFKSYLSVALSLILMGIYIVVAYKYFESGLYIGVSKQLLAMLLTNISALVVQFYFENKEKSFINNAFKQYISPELIDAMVDQEIMPTLGGEKSNITAYFTDIASFSTFSEKIGDPSKLVELLNEYLTAMTDTLLSNKGTLDKYEGDAIIAFFGAPMPLENHAQSACDSAIDMQNKLLQLRKKWASEGNKWPKVVHDMHMRIGINSGDIVTGNMGSTMRKNYTMMGDAVNLAARLESAAKQYGAYIQISEDTQKHLDEGRFIYRSLDTIRVIGKSQPVKTFELLEKTGCENEATLTELVGIWEKARSCYLNMEWDNAKALFEQCLEIEPHHPDRDPGSKTTPSHIYIKRCEAYKINPPVAPGEEWDGVFTATEK